MSRLENKVYGAKEGRIWEVKTPDEDIIYRIAKIFDVSRLAARILANRNFHDLDEIRGFLSPDLTALSDPMGMVDIDKAARRVIDACTKDEKIFVYADYDVDGATGAACLYLFLKELFPYLQIYIHQNDRTRDGYGLKMEYMRFAEKSGYSLIVTVDTGISNHDEVEKARDLGVDVVITDHHTVVGALPDAYAVLNPKRKDCRFRFEDLAGVGVVFALICAIRKILREKGFFREKTEPQLTKFLDLVALGTVADMAPLKGDNRIFVKNGLRQIRGNPRPGILALIDVSGIKQGHVTEGDLAYRIGPRLNAAGRIGDSSLSSAILIEPSFDRALDLARILSSENRKRQMEEDKIFKDARRLIEKKNLHNERIIVVGSKKWHIGVVGIVASKIVETYSKPALVFTFEGSDAKGSGRSKSPFDILRILNQCSHLMKRFGGHTHAAGIMMRRDRFDDFSEAIQDAARNLYEEEEIIPVIDVDAEVELSSMSAQLLEELEALSPFGIGNPEPTFLSRNLRVVDFSVRNRGMVTMGVVQDGAKYEVLAFKMGELQHMVLDRIDLLYTPKMSVFRGRSEMRLLARDLRLL